MVSLSMTIGIVIATYGSDPRWQTLADRAEVSARNQTVPADAIVRIHGETLAQARNEGVSHLNTSDAIILDADDQLTPAYIARMKEAGGTLRYPMVGRVYPDGSKKLFKYEPCDLFERNYIVIGAMFRVDDFLAVGGFDKDIPIFEDWELWIKMWLNGADIQPSESIYVAYERPDSRNKQFDLIEETLAKVRGKYMPILLEKGSVAY